MGFKVEITHLCVGQGLSVVTDITLPDGSKYLLLFDLGSSIGGRPFYDGALQTLSEKIGANGDTINYVHISHLDLDHYNKFRKLRQVHGSLITVECLVVGGVGSKDDEIKARKDRLQKKLEGYHLVNDCCYVDSGVGMGWPYSLCDNPEFPTVDIDLGDDYYYRMNPLLYRADIYPGYDTLEDSVAINTGSSLLLSSVVKDTDPYFSYLFTGDATRYTMEIFLDKCECRFGNEGKLMTISHHGTKTHVWDEVNKNFDTLERFLDKYTPACAVVSAKCKNEKGWAHPDISTIRAYEKKVTGITDSHTLTAFKDCGGTIKTAPINLGKAIYGTFGINGAKADEAYSKYLYETSSHRRYNFQVSVEKQDGPVQITATHQQIG